MINYIKILPALFIIACSNINGYCSGQYEYNANQNQYDTSITKIKQNLEYIIWEIDNNIPYCTETELSNSSTDPVKVECNKLHNILLTNEKQLKQFNDTQSINKIIKTLLYTYHEYIQKIMQLIKDPKDIRQIPSFEEVNDRIMLYFNASLNEYISINPSDKDSAMELKFYYEEIKKFKELAKILNDQEIKEIIQQKNKTFSKLYNGRFKKPTNQIINLLQDCENKLKNINPDNYLDNITKVQNNIRKLNELNGEFNTLYYNKQKSMNNNSIKKGINKVFNYSIEDVYQLSKLINDCCNYLHTEFNKIIKMIL